MKQPDFPVMLYKGNEGKAQKTVSSAEELIRAFAEGWRSHPDPIVADAQDAPALAEAVAWAGRKGEAVKAEEPKADKPKKARKPKAKA